MIWKDRLEQYPHRYTLTNVSGSTYDFTKVTGDVNEAGTPVNAENLNKLIQRDGDDIKDTVTTFTEASTRANIATGEKTSTIFGKIKKWFTDLKAHAFNDLATALGAETDKAPTNKLLNDTAALKVDKTSISTVMPISSAAASNEKVLGEKVVYDGLSTKQAKNLNFTDTVIAINGFVADATYADFPFRATVPLTGVTASMVASVVLSLADATSGKFAPVCDTYAGGVYLYSTETNAVAITIPTIVVGVV